MRSSKTLNGVQTQYYYDGQNVVNDVTDGTVSTNLRGAGYISRKTGDNAPSHFLYNIHTDVTQLANENGTVVKNYDYDAWGTPTKDEGAQIDNPIRYAGEYYDDESGMIYLRARYYQPEVGRFVSEDPAKDGMNWYRYCNGNPILYKDSNGENAYKSYGEARDLINKYTIDIATKVNNAADRARKNAEKFANIHGYGQTWDNEVDAMRHFQWNAIMEREIGHGVAVFAANNHEQAELSRNKWIKDVNGNVVRTRMNQSTLMDLWNNAVGRKLGARRDLKNKNYDELFQYAKKHNMLILDATKIFEFYGITDYIRESDWTVGVLWNQEVGTITVMKEGLPNLTLKIGI